MTKYRLQIQSISLVLALFFSNIALAAQFSNENKDCGVNNVEPANSDINFTVSTEANTSISHQQQFIRHVQTFQQMETRHRKLQEAQREAYKQHMRSRKQQYSRNNSLSADAQARRVEYIKHMNQRQELMNKMMNERRRAAQKRKQTMLQKMHQTGTTSATADET